MNGDIIANVQQLGWYSDDTQTIDVDGHPIRVRIAGPAGGTPVLLLHGIGRSLEDWVPTLDLLARDTRVIATDLPGFGFTAALPGRPGLVSFARFVFALMDAMHYDVAHLAGNSLGGAVAMTAAAFAPHRVQSLTLVSSAGLGRQVNLPLAGLIWGSLAGVPFLRRHARRRAREAADSAAAGVFRDPALATPAYLRHCRSVGAQPDFARTVTRTALSMGVPVLGCYPSWRRDLHDRLRKSTVPMLIAWGAQDAILPSKHLTDASTLLPHATTHLFADTGHMPQIERPAELAKLMTPHLASTRRPSPIPQIEATQEGHLRDVDR